MDQINEAIERSVKKLIDTNSWIVTNETCFASDPFSSFLFLYKNFVVKNKEKKREKYFDKYLIYSKI